MCLLCYQEITNVDVRPSILLLLEIRMNSCILANTKRRRILSIYREFLRFPRKYRQLKLYVRANIAQRDVTFSKVSQAWKLLFNDVETTIVAVCRQTYVNFALL